MTAKNPYFDPVDPKCDFIAEEKKLLGYWYSRGIVRRYLEKNKSSEKYFSFLDGPITANNPMGVHHAWGRTYKDLWQRYKNMTGHRQRFQNGFDCQGLWVEVEVEKELGFKNKKEIDEYGVARFVQKCKDRVNKYSEMQTEQTKRLGNFMDWDNSYFTMSDENNYMIWYFLKECNKKGLIYKGKDVVPWCYRCETAISEHEILTEDYKEVEHTSIYFRLPIANRNNEYLLVWTTTPWTIPANIAVSVDVKKDYSLIECEGKNYWILDKLITAVFKNECKELQRVKGSKLVGLKYTSLFDDLPSNQKLSKEPLFHTVVATDSLIMPISEDEGTGMVHTSTGTGAEDHRLGQLLGLPIMAAIKGNADYIEDFGYLSGQNAKVHPEIIFDLLKNKEDGKYLFKLMPYKHRYPACWRCKNELVWKLTNEWYIAIDPVRENMKKVARKVKWIPSFGLKRELDWLSNMHDWLISKKNRYWGLALPIWECECGNFEIIGEYQELKERAVKGWSDFEGHTPHKPYIDKVIIKCSKCGKDMKRISDVGNPWLDAGIVPFSTISKDNKSNPLYITNKDEFLKWFPADFITESFPGQFKNWFYSVLAMSTILENEEPYKTVLGFATLLAEDGRPMHKSWGNSIEFNEGAEKIGADVMRWMYLRSNPSDNLLFGYKTADETRRQFHLKFWNVYNFFVSYANIDKWKPLDNSAESKNILDIWIHNRLNNTVDEVTKMLEKYDPSSSCSVIDKFVDDLSVWYIRRSRERVGPGSDNISDKNAFYRTIYDVLTMTCRLLAPFTPFLSDMMYQNLTKEESVHLSDWPVVNRNIKKDASIGKNMDIVREIVEKAHAKRKEAGVPVRQPLSELFITGYNNVNKDLEELLKDELNVKKITNKSAKGDKNVEYDLVITPELLEEAKTRELIRKIQNERKVLGVNLSDKVNIKSDWLPENTKLLDLIKRKTLAIKITKDILFEVSK